MSSKQRKRFIHPFNKRIGRRTGKDVLAGKTIRRKDDGMENFEDYLSDSDMDVTREVSRLHALSEESDSALSQSSKENQPVMSSSIAAYNKRNNRNNSTVSQSAPNITSEQSTLSQDSKLNGTKLGWFRNKRIGRRTGKDVLANKIITKNEDGFENFADYLSESDVSTISSRLSVSMRETSRKSREYNQSSSVKSTQDRNSQDEITSDDGEPVTDDVGSQKSETEQQVDEVSVNHTEPVTDDSTKIVVQADIHSSVESLNVDTENLDQESENETEKTLQEVSENTNNTQCKSDSEEKNINQTVKGTGSKSVEQSNHDSNRKSTTSTVITGQSDSQSDRLTESDSDAGQDDQDEDKEENLTSNKPAEKSQTEIVYEYLSKSFRENETDRDHRNKDSGHHAEEEQTGEAHTAEHTVEKSSKSNTKNVSKNSRKSDTGSKHKQSDVPIDFENNVDNDENCNETDSDNVRVSHVTDTVTHTVEDDNDSEREIVHSESVPDVNSQTDTGADISYNGTNIDVAGNLSGSITKRDLHASAVSFNRTRKRLSYSALEKSEEMTKKHRKRIEEANDELRKDDNSATVTSSKTSVTPSKSSNSSKSPTKNQVLPKVLNKEPIVIADTGDNDCDIMCLTSRTARLNNSHNTAVNEDIDSDDDILIMDDEKQRVIGNDRRKKPNSKLKSDKNEKLTSVSSENEKLGSEIKKPKMKKSKRTQRNKAENRHKSTGSEEETNVDSEKQTSKSVKRKQKSKSKKDSEKLETSDLVTSTVNDLIETGDVYPDDEQNESINSRNKTTNMSQVRGKSAIKRNNTSKKLNKSVSPKKKSKRQSEVVSEDHIDGGIDQSVSDTTNAVSQNKSSKKVKRKPLSTDSSDSSPKQRKTSVKSVTTKRTKQKLSRSKGQRSATSGNSSSDDNRVPHHTMTATPDAGTVSTHFGSGVSFRVSRRSELLKNVGSGYVGEVQSVEMEPVGSLTPCITQPGANRRLKGGRRVTLCPEENTMHEFAAEKSLSDTDVCPTARNFRHSYGMGDSSPLPSPNSTPVHIHEVTHTATPHPGESSDEIIVDRLIKPSPPIDGLRRSSRTRLKPVEWYKNEQVVFDYRRRSGPAIIGVKPSREIDYIKIEDKKRKKRQLLQQLRRTNHKSKLDRKLSIHFDLPEDAMMVQDQSLSEITVLNEMNEEVVICCVARKDQCKPIKSPKKEDPYVITRMLDHPCMSAGKLMLKAKALKPERLVTAEYLLCNIEYGKVLVKIHNTSTVLESGDIFMVPFGKTYSVQNLRADNAHINYTVHKSDGQFSDDEDDADGGSI